MTSANATAPAPDLSVLRRPSGAFAMLAVDQREAMRAMFAEHRGGPVTDERLTAFKLAAARILTPYESWSIGSSPSTGSSRRTRSRPDAA